MKYLVATFKIEVEADLMQVCRDLLADSSAEAGFESFEETEQGLEAYVQKDFFDKGGPRQQYCRFSHRECPHYL